MRKFLVSIFLLPFLLTLKAASFYQHSIIGSTLSGLSPCSSLSCKNLNNFIFCLRSEVSPYRYYGYRPQLANTPKAKEAYRRFVQAHPRCFENFCQSVCTLPPENYRKDRAIPKTYQPPSSFESSSSKLPIRSHRRSNRAQSSNDFSDDFDSEDSFDDEESEFNYGNSYGFADDTEQRPSRFSRARKTFFGGLKKGYRGFRSGINSTHRWATRKYNKRQDTLRKKRAQKAAQASRICTMNSPEGTQLRALCSACVSHLPPSYQLVPACHVNAAGIPYESSAGGELYRSTSQSHMRNTAFDSSDDGSIDRTPMSATNSRRAAPSPQKRPRPRHTSTGSIHYSQFGNAPAQRPSFQAAFGSRGSSTPRESQPQSASGSQATFASSHSAAESRSVSGDSAISSASQSGESPSTPNVDGFDDVEPFWDR